MRRALFAVLFLGVSAASQSVAESLPPIACVEALRKGRIAGESGDTQARQRQLEAALSSPGCELPSLVEVARLQQTGGETPARAASARQQLSTRLEDPAVELPLGLVDLIASLYESRDERERLLASLERRRSLVSASGSRASPEERAELERTAARLQQALNRPEQARESVARLLALERSDVNLWWALDLDLELERWESAAGLLREMLPRSGAGGAHLEGIYIDVLARLGRLEEIEARTALYSTAELGAGVARRRWLAEACVDAAWKLRDAGRDADAEALFRKALVFDPDQASARSVVLNLYASPGERAAHAAAVAARREDERDAQALYEEGTQLLAAGDSAGAIDLLTRAAPELGGTTLAEPAWYNLGLAAYKLERWQQAAEAFGRAAELNPGRAETFLQRGIALQRSNACGEAVGVLRRALELAPERFQAHYYLARCYEALGDGEAATRETEEYRRAKDGRR